MLLRKTAVFSALSVVLVAVPVQAGSPAVAISAGTFNIDKESGEDSATVVGVEYRGAPYDNFFGIAPMVGIEANQDDAYWVYAGGRYEFKLNARWSLTPHLAVSYYEDGDSLDLGGEIQFRSGIDLSLRLNETTSAFVALTHLSNAGLEDHNPGVNSLMLGISFDL